LTKIYFYFLVVWRLNLQCWRNEVCYEAMEPCTPCKITTTQIFQMVPQSLVVETRCSGQSTLILPGNVDVAGNQKNYFIKLKILNLNNLYLLLGLSLDELWIVVLFVDHAKLESAKRVESMDNVQGELLIGFALFVTKIGKTFFTAVIDLSDQSSDSFLNHPKFKINYISLKVKFIKPTFWMLGSEYWYYDLQQILMKYSYSYHLFLHRLC